MKLHHVSFGSGPAVVFLGSIASSTDMWLPQLDALADRFQVIALDHPGHGKSAEPTAQPGSTTVADLADNVLQTLDSMQVDSFAVVGLSMGGAIAQHLAATSPRVTKAAFLCTATAFGGREKWEQRAQLTRAEGMAPMVDGVVGLWVSDAYATTHPATTHWYREMILSTSGEGYAHGADALGGWDNADELAKITCPVLTLAGADDQSTPPATVHAIADGVAGETTTVTVPGGHVPTLESADQVNRALADFLT